MNKISAKLLEQIIEGALLVSGKAISITDVKGYFGEEDVMPSTSEVRAAFQKLMKRYKTRGIELKEVASGYRFQVAEVVAPYVIKQWEERPQKYSRALLETLALIAYRQPITRGDIEDIRGVSVSSNIVRTLLEREWVRVVGHKDVPGRPALYATTSKFLDYFNLKSLTELPELSEIKDLESINPELDFGDDFQLSAPNAQGVDKEVSVDQNAEFDGVSADLIPDSEEPTDEAVVEISEAEKEALRLAKEAAHKEKELQQELAAREELQDIDRFNNAFEKMIRSPDAQTLPVSDQPVSNETNVEAESATDMPGWWVDAQTNNDGTSPDDTDLTDNVELPNDTETQNDVDASKSRFATWADRLEASVNEVEQQELLAEEALDTASAVSVSIDRTSSDSTSSNTLQDEEAEVSSQVVKAELDNSGAESKLTERTYGQQIAGEEMSEEDIQRLIQQKLAEQAALLNDSPSEDDTED
jgi:segregation and condensation protein B